MLILIIIIFAIGWVLGLHLPWWLCWIIYGASFYKLNTSKGGLQDVFTWVFLMVAMVGTVIAWVIYGDATEMLNGIKFIFTGE